MYLEICEQTSAQAPCFLFGKRRGSMSIDGLGLKDIKVVVQRARCLTCCGQGDTWTRGSGRRSLIRNAQVVTPSEYTQLCRETRQKEGS